MIPTYLGAGNMTLKKVFTNIVRVKPICLPTTFKNLNFVNQKNTILYRRSTDSGEMFYDLRRIASTYLDKRYTYKCVHIHRYRYLIYTVVIYNYKIADKAGYYTKVYRYLYLGYLFH